MTLITLAIAGRFEIFLKIVPKHCDPLRFSSLRPGNLNKKERDLFTDNTEISPWNAYYEFKDKKIKKPNWRYLMGTMPDLQLMCQKHTILLGFCF